MTYVNFLVTKIQCANTGSNFYPINSLARIDVFVTFQYSGICIFFYDAHKKKKKFPGV